MVTKVLEQEITGNRSFIHFDDNYENYRILVRSNKQPLGWVSFSRNQSGSIGPEELQQAIKNQLGPAIIQEALKRSFSFPKENSVPVDEAGISVVVCTRNRTKLLANCLEKLLELEYNKYEVIIVDNVPDNDDTFQLVSNLPVRYFRENRPGLDWARNRGIAEAKYDIVAFTDDDVRVDAYWLQAISKTFLSKDIMGVSGYVAPAELITPAQHVFEFGYGGMGHGFHRRYLKKENLTEQELLWASNFGIGANMAFRKEIFQQIGGFDTALDVGTPSHGGGDIEFFHRLVSKGFHFVYEPAAMIWHYHRKDKKALRRQIFDNGRSFGCYLINCFLKKTVNRFSIIQFFLFDWLINWNFKNLIKPKNKIPGSFSIYELLGMCTSPFAYWQTKRTNKKIARDIKFPGS